jgi:ubiquinone/menaquinone biosynthesis C-methylase UbiE
MNGPVVRPEGTPVGNLYDKYETRNPLARWLMAGFLKAVSDLYRQADARSLLEIGCGEGLLTQHLLRSNPAPEKVAACDLSLNRLAPDLDPRIEFFEASAYELPIADRSYDLVVCCEVLEHLENPAAALAEIARVARRFVLLSTPREPLWRALNLARGSYIKALGNTPGHVQHFSRRALCRLAQTELAITDVRSPLPWTVLLARASSRPGP